MALYYQHLLYRSFVSFLIGETKTWYQNRIFWIEFLPVTGFYVVTLLFKLIVALTTSVTLLVLRHKDIALRKHLKKNAVVINDTSSHRSGSH